MYFFPVMPISKTKGMVTVQPSEIDMSSFRSGIVYACHKIDLS
jgi:hypothetical protein